ncbi:MAG: enoyl-CoA hydratase/isomerase family protein [Acidimicrobiales bacterium]
MQVDDAGLSFECLLTRMEGSTLVLTFNRPEARNSINWTMERELWMALAAAQRLDEVRAVVLTGAGEMFSAGHDLKQVAREARDGGPQVDGEWWARQTTMLPSWNFTKPLIAAVHGFVGPFANGILLTADFVIATRGTRFSFEHARTGVGRPWGPYALMYFMFPPRVVYKLWALGGWMDADQAEALHYVQRVVERDELDSVAMHWAEQCSLIDSEGFAHTKQGMHEMYEAMGLLDMVEIGRQPMVPPSAEAVQRSIEFNKTWKHQGAKAALALRDAGVDPDFSQV